MSASVRILCLLIFAVGVAYADARQLALAWLLIILSWVSVRPPWRELTTLLQRIRWLLISLLIIYAWFTPGTPLLPALAGWSPTLAGLSAGAMRAAALLAMVCAVHALIMTCPRPQLLAGIYRLTAPFGGFRERLTARLLLTMEALPRVQELVRARVALARGEGVRPAFATHAGALFQSILLAGEHQPRPTLEVPAESPVPLYQWAYPVFLLLLFQLVAL